MNGCSIRGEFFGECGVCSNGGRRSARTKVEGEGRDGVEMKKVWRDGGEK